MLKSGSQLHRIRLVAELVSSVEIRTLTSSATSNPNANRSRAVPLWWWHRRLACDASDKPTGGTLFGGRRRPPQDLFGDSSDVPLDFICCRQELVRPCRALMMRRTRPFLHQRGANHARSLDREHRATFRPRLEQLENRVVPVVGAFAVPPPLSATDFSGVVDSTAAPARCRGRDGSLTAATAWWTTREPSIRPCQRHVSRAGQPTSLANPTSRYDDRPFVRLHFPGQCSGGPALRWRLGHGNDIAFSGCRVAPATRNDTTSPQER